MSGKAAEKSRNDRRINDAVNNLQRSPKSDSERPDEDQKTTRTRPSAREAAERMHAADAATAKAQQHPDKGMLACEGAADPTKSATTREERARSGGATMDDDAATTGTTGMQWRHEKVLAAVAT